MYSNYAKTIDALCVILFGMQTRCFNSEILCDKSRYRLCLILDSLILSFSLEIRMLSLLEFKIIYIRITLVL